LRPSCGRRCRLRRHPRHRSRHCKCSNPSRLCPNRPPQRSNQSLCQQQPRSTSPWTREQERQKKLAQAQQEKQRLDRLREEKLQEAKRKQALQKLKDAQEKKDAEKAARQLEEQRSKNLARMAGMAGASGTAESTGTALRSSGPSASYAGRIRARIKPNIVFTKDIAGNPTAEVEVRTSPDGTIVGRKLLKSSGIDAWDDAVLQAIDKTEVLPRDIDGRVPPLLEISFRPKD
jgi:colicin import membrane protein